MTLKVLAAIWLAALGYVLIGSLTADPVDPVPFGQAFPLWALKDQSCVDPDPAEKAKIEQATHAIASMPHTDAARKALFTLAYGLHRDSRRVCESLESLDKVSSALTATRLFDRRLDEVDLRLAAKLGSLSLSTDRYVIEKIAQAAFGQAGPHQLRLEHRPSARSTLASFGRAASDWADIAYDEISGWSALGTGAAQVAVAAGHPLALKKVEQTIKSLLPSRTGTVPYSRAQHIQELGYALVIAGPEAAKPYLEPFREFMRRKRQDWAGHYGWVEVWPRHACRILVLATGNPEEVRREFEYCAGAAVSARG